MVAGPQEVRIAPHYRLPVPGSTCFVIGDVIFCRKSADWLLDPPQSALLEHEVRHTYQYAPLGPIYWPLYFASCAWSYAITGSAGARNVFERRAGLAGGGYRDAPVRLRPRALSRILER
jgi:hypothetical protein